MMGKTDMAFAMVSLRLKRGEKRERGSYIGMAWRQHYSPTQGTNINLQSLRSKENYIAMYTTEEYKMQIGRK